MTDVAARRIDLIADFIEALAKRGLPPDATLADLIQHERGVPKEATDAN